jgi:hypothetical protein
MEDGRWKMEDGRWGVQNVVLILPIYIVWDFVNLYICIPKFSGH